MTIYNKTLEFTGLNDTKNYSSFGNVFNANDTLLVTNAGYGNDVIYGSKNMKNNISGGVGNDTIYGNKKNDILNGGADNDLLDGAGGNDTLKGDAGNDTILGGLGADVMDGGTGIDTISYAASASGIYVDLLGSLVSGFSNSDAYGDTISGFENAIGSAFNDVIYAGTGANIMDGGAGIDTLSYSGTTTAVTMNLNGGVGVGGAVGDTAVNFENITGGSGNDTLGGTSGNNIINGGVAGSDKVSYNGYSTGVTVNLYTQFAYGVSSGSDTLVSIENVQGTFQDDYFYASSAANYFNGGISVTGVSNVDTVSYSYSDAGVNVNLLTGVGSGGYAAGDTYSVMENVIGTKYADVLTGNNSANILDGDASNDIIEGGGGADKLIGGLGTDTLVYTTSTAGVTVDLEANTATGGHANGDIISDFENVTGSAYDDNFTGTLTANTFNGLANTSTGGDTVSYLNSTAGVQINLSLTGMQISTGYGSGDILTNIENLTGSNWGDTLTGNAGANFLSGMNGADSIYGGAGNDTLRGGAGADYFEGGAGFDFVDYRDSTSTSNWGVVVNLGSAVAISGYTAYGNYAQGDNGFVSVEGIYGSDFDDSLFGDMGDNIIYSGNRIGSDFIDGWFGNDTLYGGTSTTGGVYFADGDGEDVVWGGSAYNNYSTGNGNDIFHFSGFYNEYYDSFGDDIVYGSSTGASSIIDSEGNDTYYFVAGVGNALGFNGAATVANIDTVYGYTSSATNTISLTPAGLTPTDLTVTQCFNDVHIVFGLETLVLVNTLVADVNFYW